MQTEKEDDIGEKSVMRTVQRIHRENGGVAGFYQVRIRVGRVLLIFFAVARESRVR